MTMTLQQDRLSGKLSMAAATDEGLRLFFPLAALHAALWPLLWALLWGFGLPFTSQTSPGQWHAQEMIFGSFGAALLGFLLSALPEWTETERLHGRSLLALAALWGLARLAGFLGVESLIVLAGLCDFLWLCFLCGYVVLLSVRLRTSSLAGFLVFLAGLAFSAVILRYSMLSGDYDLGERAVSMAGTAFLGLLGLALARITVPVTNRMLDPLEETSPYRPHPARINLAPGLCGLLLLAQAAGASGTVQAYLAIAAGAAFLDRVAEGFVGREGWKWELAGLWLSSLLAGTGLVLNGLAAIGLPLPDLAGRHIMLMGGLGLGVFQVLSIAGLLHTGQPLDFSARTKLALWLLMLAVIARVLPEFLPDLSLPGGAHGIAALAWALALGLWISAYLPLLWSPETLENKSC